jgi:hypothetical protein
VNLGEDASKPLKSLLAPKSQPFFFAFLFTWDYSLTLVNLGEDASKTIEKPACSEVATFLF